MGRGIVWLGVAFVANYWGHRLSHELPWLWRLHRVHHSSTHIDWLATAHFPRHRAPAGYGADDLPGDLGYLASLVSPVSGRTRTR